MNGNRALRIALTVDPELPVPPKLYGGVERIVDLLAQGLVARGHDVTLFAHQESRTAGKLVPWPGRDSRSKTDTIRNALSLARQVLGGRFDVVHSHSRIAYLTPILPLALPKVMTYHRTISQRTVTLGHRLSRGSLSFTAVGAWMTGHVAQVGQWSIVPNAVNLARYTFQPEVAPDAPLVFLGRVEHIKGPHRAIAIARATGRRLLIAGNIPPEQRGWVEAHVLPHVDGDRIRYVGPVDDVQKDALLGSAASLLMPIEWDEPFGLVMVEALACGTPVLGLDRGAVGEVVIDGRTGFVRKTLDDLIATVAQVPALSRRACRDDAEARFGKDSLVETYLAVYRAAIARRAGVRT